MPRHSSTGSRIGCAACSQVDVRARRSALIKSQQTERDRAAVSTVLEALLSDDGIVEDDVACVLVRRLLTDPDRGLAHRIGRLEEKRGVS